MSLIKYIAVEWQHGVDENLDENEALDFQTIANQMGCSRNLFKARYLFYKYL